MNASRSTLQVDTTMGYGNARRYAKAVEGYSNVLEQSRPISYSVQQTGTTHYS
jgi:hypothetical protein